MRLHRRLQRDAGGSTKAYERLRTMAPTASGKAQSNQPAEWRDRRSCKVEASQRLVNVGRKVMT
jgi:hypothetical protein